MRTIHRLGIALLALALAGCAQVKKQAFNAELNQHIKTVTIVHGGDQPQYPVQIVGHPAGGFGLIGAVIIAAEASAKAARLTKALDPAETRLQQRFGQTLAAELTASGYEVAVLVPGRRATPAPSGAGSLRNPSLPAEDPQPESGADIKVDKLFEATKGQVATDAVLLVQFGGGYWAAGPNTDYLPRIFAVVRKQDTKTGAVLYEDSFTYGYRHPNWQSVHVDSPPDHRFKDMDALLADPTKTRDALIAGKVALAKAIAADVKRK